MINAFLMNLVLRTQKECVCGWIATIFHHFVFVKFKWQPNIYIYIYIYIYALDSNDKCKLLRIYAKNPLFFHSFLLLLICFSRIDKTVHIVRIVAWRVLFSFIN